MILYYFIILLFPFSFCCKNSSIFDIKEKKKNLTSTSTSSTEERIILPKHDEVIESKGENVVEFDVNHYDLPETVFMEYKFSGNYSISNYLFEIKCNKMEKCIFKILTAYGVFCGSQIEKSIIPMSSKRNIRVYLKKDLHFKNNRVQCLFKVRGVEKNVKPTIINKIIYFKESEYKFLPQLVEMILENINGYKIIINTVGTEVISFHLMRKKNNFYRGYFFYRCLSLENLQYRIIFKSKFFFEKKLVSKKLRFYDFELQEDMKIIMNIANDPDVLTCTFEFLTPVTTEFTFSFDISTSKSLSLVDYKKQNEMSEIKVHGGNSLRITGSYFNLPNVIKFYLVNYKFPDVFENIFYCKKITLGCAYERLYEGKGRCLDFYETMKAYQVKKDVVPGFKYEIQYEKQKNIEGEIDCVDYIYSKNSSITPTLYSKLEYPDVFSYLKGRGHSLKLKKTLRYFVFFIQNYLYYLSNF